MVEAEGGGGSASATGRDLGWTTSCNRAWGLPGLAFARDLWLGVFQCTYFTFSSTRNAATQGGCCCEELVWHFAFPEWRSTLKFSISCKYCIGRLQGKGKFSFWITGNTLFSRPDRQVVATGGCPVPGMSHANALGGKLKPCWPGLSEMKD